MNGTTHRWVAALATGAIVHHYQEKNHAETVVLPTVSSLLGSVLTNLPDLLEPAIHPDHRDFFHSLTFAALLGLSMKELCEWKPHNDWDKAIRYVLLVGGWSYLVHLTLDAMTKKSLPLIGKKYIRSMAISPRKY